MLIIDQPVVRIFESQARAQVMARIDRWLAQGRPDWAALDPGTRQQALPAMLDAGQGAGMTCERDLAVFASVCVALGSGWHDRIAEPRVADVLADPGYRPEAKLLWLGEVFHL